MNRKQKKILVRIVLTAVLVVVLGALPLQGLPRLALYLLAYLVIGYDILRKAGRGIWNRQVFDENFLMAVATIGAFVLAIYTRSGDYTEAIAVMLFYQVGELFQSYAVGKSRKNISALMDIRPDYANLEKDGQLEQVDPGGGGCGQHHRGPAWREGAAGRRGGRGEFHAGYQRPHRREPTPGDRPGEEIVSGCINMTGVLKVRTTKEAGESTVSKSWIRWRTPALGSPARRTSSPNSQESTPLPSVMRRWRWRSCRRWPSCFWEGPRPGASRSTGR